MVVGHIEKDTQREKDREIERRRLDGVMDCEKEAAVGAFMETRLFSLRTYRGTGGNGLAVLSTCPSLG